MSRHTYEIDEKMDSMSEKIVTVDPEILGGKPVFRGTRVPVGVLFENLEDGLTLDEILDAYPTLSRGVALKALHQAAYLLEQHAMTL